MFTGIIEEIGIIGTVSMKNENSLLEIQAKKVLADAKLGSSIAVNGVCLTVIEVKKSCFVAEATKETLSRSNLGIVRSGCKVNLERPLKADGRFDGHIVMGHIDSTGVIKQIRKEKGSWLVKVETDSKFVKYIVNKGSIAVDGISLTVTECTGNMFTLNIIPHTFEVTTLKERKPGDKVNIEVDIIAKYAEKLHGNIKESAKELQNENGYTV